MFTLPVHSSLLLLPAFSIIREITHFPSNLTPQNLRKCVRARSLANFIFMIFTVILDLIYSVPICFWLRTTRHTVYETICPLAFPLLHFFSACSRIIYFFEEGKFFNARIYLDYVLRYFQSLRNLRQVFSGMRK